MAAALLALASPALADTPPAKAQEPIALEAPKDFASAVAAVERAAATKAEPLEGLGGQVPEGEGRAFAVEGKVAERLLAGSHAAFRGAGFYLFRYERSYGMAGEKDRLGLLKTGDRNAVLRRMGTSAAKRGDIARRL